MAKKHVITFDQFGELSVDATGYVGKACESVTDKLLVGLVATKTGDTKKPEYDMTERAGATETVKNRW